jgi:peptidoglycan/LPS O-acetylase OafA/YrhL
LSISNQKVAEPGHVLGIDSLRALAVWVVIVYHLNASFLPGGFVGVDIFFAISGFVITKSLLERAKISL